MPYPRIRARVRCFAEAVPADAADVQANDPAVRAVLDALRASGVDVTLASLPDPSILPDLLALVNPEAAEKLGKSVNVMAGGKPADGPQNFSEAGHFLRHGLTPAGRQRLRDEHAIDTRLDAYVARRNKELDRRDALNAKRS